MRLRLEQLPSPIGKILLVSDGDALRALDFDTHEDRMHRLLRLHYGRYELAPGPAPAAVRAAVAAYFEGDCGAIDAVPVATGGTAFQRAVWRALRAVPSGATTSYGRLAAHLGRPGASRAVGLANGSNPIGIVVPCHRVVRADGSLTGYGGGLHRKRWLLEHERAAALAPPDSVDR